MSERFQTGHPELDDLFERYRAAPKGHVFAPLADACRKAGMLEEALEICARGVGEHPRYASGYVVQGKCLYDSGRAKDAQAAFDRVLEIDPKNLVALKYLGIIHSERGETLIAREYFEHILALDPGDREIRSRMEDVTHHEPAGRSTKVPAREVPSTQPVSTPVTIEPPVDETSFDELDETSAGEEAVLLPDVADEEFKGETITLRDESVTSDEIATITLADIYASQGYTTRALRIYREVYKRQPANRVLAAKIERLEKEEAASRPVAKPAPEPRKEPARKAPPAAAPARAPDAEGDKPTAPAQAAPPTGHPIDQSRNYEQFKRWLKASNR